MSNCITDLLYYNAGYELRLKSTGPSGPSTTSDGSPFALGPGVTHRPWFLDNTDNRLSGMMYISNEKYEIEAMVCYSYYLTLMALIDQMHYTAPIP